MMRIVSLAALSVTLAACGGSELESNVPMKMSTDATTQSLHSATCTRGNSAFKLFVAKDGTATGRIVQTEAQKKARVPPVEFPASLRATDKKTVLLEIPVSEVTSEPVAETLSPVIKGGELVLRGDSFDCTDVRVREFS